ncbi:MAG: hypothetical protein GY737_07100 [Desulfobacteraceae bacterium]|nr:hypothetical protein [Desulfobacteraceae bacterium]
MKALQLLTVLLVFVLGLFIGSWYQISKQTFRSEELIAREIMLLEKCKELPKCSMLSAAKTDWGRITTDDGVVIWKYNIDKNTLQKVIVDKEMTVAYEKINAYCP